MRQIILDTETTGLEPALGHRIIEIGCVEIVNRRPTGRTWHRYLNPEREIDEGALAVHGISRADLEREPRFVEVAEELIGFLEGAELVIHNAAFDIAFLEAEFALLAKATGRSISIGALCRVLDTLALAREMHPGQRNSLDALCKRYSVDNSRRELHGALLDAQILLEVYLAMTGGQAALSWDEDGEGATAARELQGRRHLERPEGGLIILEPSPEELLAHDALLQLIAKASGGRCVWLESA